MSPSRERGGPPFTRFVQQSREKERLGQITKEGQADIRRLLIIGAT